jgi:plastocyanin
MAISYGQQVVAVVASSPVSFVKPFHWLATMHMIVGGITMLAALFLIIRMNFRLPFKFLRIKWWKNLMRATLAGFYAAVGLGVATYLVWYVVPTQAAGVPVVEVEGKTTVPMANFAFVPFDLTVPAGTTVVWVNQDEAPHTMTFDDSSVDSGVMNAGQTFEFTFDTVGRFQYFCAFHGSPGIQGMAGFVNVVSGSEVAVAPTEAPAPTATPAPTPNAQPIIVNLPPVAVGFLEFRDNLAVNDEILLTASNVSAPTDGSTLEFWIDGPAGPKSLGPIQVDASGAVNHIYTDPLQSNLVAQYNSFFVSIEPPGDADPASSGQFLLQGSVPPASHQAVQPILVTADVAPNNGPLLTPFRFDVEDAIRHADSMVAAVNSGDLRSVTRHAEHVVNIIEGRDGPNYGDLDNNGTVFDPSDGFGLLNYAQLIVDHARAAAEAEGANDVVAIHSAHTVASAQNVIEWAQQADALAVQLNSTTDFNQASALAVQLADLTKRIRDGVDANGNGIVEPITGEGGMWSTYLHAQYMVSMGVVPVQE